jgi:hypothetical protein
MLKNLTAAIAVIALSLSGAATGAALAGNTTYPTGTQSRQPNDPPCANPFGCGRGWGPFYANPPGRDVYCQQSPGLPMYGPYPRTGTNTRCGPGFAPRPPVQPQPSPATSCPLAVGSADPVDDAAASAVAAVFRVDQPPELLLTQYSQSNGGNGLYVAGRQVLEPSNTGYAGFQAWLLQKPLRSEIFKAMACSKRRHFEFNSATDLMYLSARDGRECNG